MLKCNIHKIKDIVKVKAKGTAQELLVETAMVVKTVYQGVHESSPEAAAQYKNKLIGLLLDPNSPVWKENDHE